MTSDRIFSSRRGTPPELQRLVAAAFVAAIAASCAVDGGDESRLLVLFGVPAAVFGALIGQWWALLVPVGLTTVAIAIGVECSASEQPQALLLGGTFVGIALRRLRDRATGAL